jgi:hypothetical protein
MAPVADITDLRLLRGHGVLQLRHRRLQPSNRRLEVRVAHATRKRYRSSVRDSTQRDNSHSYYDRLSAVAARQNAVEVWLVADVFVGVRCASTKPASATTTSE